MVQIINLFPSVSVVIELPIPSIQGGWNRRTFFSLSLRIMLSTEMLHWLYLELWYSATLAIHSLRFTVKSPSGRIILSSDVLPGPVKTCSHWWSTLKRDEHWLTGTQHSNVHLKLLKISRCGNQPGDVTGSLCVSVISCGYKKFLPGIFQYFYDK